MDQSKHSRLGRASIKLIAIVAAGLAGTAAIVPQWNPRSNTPLATQSLDPSGDEFIKEIAPSQEASPEDANSGEANSGKASPEDEPIHVHLDDKPLAAQAQASVQAQASARSILVHYATDRHRVDPLSWIHWSRIIVPTTVGGMVFLVMLLAVIKARQKVVWTLGALFSLLLTVNIGYEATLLGIQTRRLIAQGSIYFGTERRADSGDSYPLHLGQAQVTIPPSHRAGDIERPSLLRFEFSEDAAKHVMIQKVDALEEQAFYESVRESVDRSQGQSALLFIHGYNVQFEDALRRTAQISADLRFDGVTLLYSWPSHGRLTRYTYDEANSAWSVPHLERLLLDLRARTGVKQLHLMAHSMGNRILLGALERIALRKGGPEGPPSPRFAQVILAAPDVDIDEFQNRYAAALDQLSQRATIYASSSDRALLASMTIHGNARLGIGGDSVRQFPGVDSIDVSPIDTSLLGHSYYGNHPLMIQDLGAVLGMGKPASARDWLAQWWTSQGSVAYRFRPEVAAAHASRR